MSGLFSSFFSGRSPQNQQHPQQTRAETSMEMRHMWGPHKVAFNESFRQWYNELEIWDLSMDKVYFPRKARD